MRLGIAAGVSLTVLLSGCATVLGAPDLTGSTSSLTFAKGYDEVRTAGNPASAYYTYFEGVDCKRGMGTGFSWATGPNRTLTAPAGRKIFIKAITGIYWSTGGGGLASKTCTDFVGFTPRPGGRYSVINRAQRSHCIMQVVDLDSGQAPPDLKFMSSQEQCSTWMRLPAMQPRPPLPIPAPPRIAPPIART